MDTENAQGGDAHRPLAFEDAMSSKDPMLVAASFVGKVLTYALEECRNHGIDDEKTLGLAIAASLSAYVKRYGPEASLGFVGDSIQYLNQSLIHLVESIPYDAEDGPGLVARVEYDPIRSQSGARDSATQGVARSTSGALYLLDVSSRDAKIAPVTLEQALHWIGKHGHGEVVKEISARLRKA